MSTALANTTLAPLTTTVAPVPTPGGGPGIIVERNASDALGPLCGWTEEDAVCYGTVIPIMLSFVVLVALLVRQLWVTPQHSALQTLIKPHESPLLPTSFRYFDAAELNGVIGGVSDMPLKQFLPRIGLGELVEPCATLGIANVKDLLQANRLALRDIGVGPRESRLFSRALERRVRIREKMQAVFLSTSASFQNRARAPTLTQRAREAAVRRMRETRAAAAAAAAAEAGEAGSDAATPRNTSLATPRSNFAPTPNVAASTAKQVPPPLASSTPNASPDGAATRGEATAARRASLGAPPLAASSPMLIRPRDGSAASATTPRTRPRDGSTSSMAGATHQSTRDTSGAGAGRLGSSPQSSTPPGPQAGGAAAVGAGASGTSPGGDDSTSDAQPPMVRMSTAPPPTPPTSYAPPPMPPPPPPEQERSADIGGADEGQ